MIVYRLEDEDGRGPYSSRVLSEADKKKYVFHPHSPCGGGALDDIQGFGLRHVCGFTSVRQMRDWFGDEFLGGLISAGMRIVRYNVPEEAVLRSKSGAQVGFLKEAGINVKRK